MQAGKELRIRVIEKEGKKRFEAEGVSGRRLLAYYVFHGTIELIRDGVCVDTAVVDSIGTHAAVDFFRGFEKTLGSDYHEWFVSADRFMAGDELVVPVVDEHKPEMFLRPG